MNWDETDEQELTDLAKAVHAAADAGRMQEARRGQLLRDIDTIGGLLNEKKFAEAKREKNRLFRDVRRMKAVD